MLQTLPTTADFEGFLRLSPSSEATNRNLRVVRHLLAVGDDEGWNPLSTLGWTESRLDRLFHLSGSETAENAHSANSYDYSLAFKKAEEATDAFFATDQCLEQQPDLLLRELEAMSVEELAACIATESRLVHPILSKRLIERSHAARYENPERMLHLARLSRLVADACSSALTGGALRLADLRTRAWGHLGNSLRVCGQLQEAEQALNTAQQYQREGTGDPLLHARLLEQIASLHIFQRRFASAIELSNQAGQIHQELGETHLLASTMVQKAIASFYAGEPESAVAILNHAIPLIDQEEDPYLLLAACHNLVLCYIDLDLPEKALSLYFEARSLYQGFGDALLLLRNAWQEGRLLRDLGHFEGAEAALIRAREGFVQRNLAYEVAVISLDLSSVYVKLGKAEQVRQMVAETVPLFRALQVDREMIAALLEVRRFSDQQAALDQIHLLTTHLERLSKKSA